MPTDRGRSGGKTFTLGGDPSTDPTEAAAPTAGPAEEGPDAGERYVGPALLGAGGMGTVWAVTDRLFDRIVALKTLRPGADPLAVRRFLDEARITARLDHPGVVAVHDQGRTADGRPYLVMQRVEGRTLEQLIAERAATGEPTVRRLLDVLRGVADTLAFAHERGVVHRDLKPANVMVGRHGDARLMDWGIAQLVGAEPEVPSPPPAAGDAPHTATGTITGTPRYVSPEQARSEPVGTASDVFTLGLLLVEVVTGRPLRSGRDATRLLLQALLPAVVPDSLPDGLADLARRALATRPEERPTAAGFARALGDWLAGEDRADLARVRLAEAEATLAAAEVLRAQEDELRDAARALELEPARLRERWALEDRRHALALERTAREAEGDRLLGLALAHAPELDVVHAALASVARGRCERAEADGQRLEAARQEALVARHDRGAHRAWLAGDGALTLCTDPPGAPVTARRLVTRDRRIEPEGEPLALGVTPLEAVPLPRGSWLLDVGGCAVPVFLRRAEHWDQVPPGERASRPLRLVRPGPGEAWVPEGWALLGGDPEARHPRPRARVWVDGFVMRVHPVTHAEYLAWLLELVASGRADEAERRVPRATGVVGEPTPAVYRWEDGRWHLPEPDWAELPVFLVDQPSAAAYAAWEAARTGLPWRLATRAEREKAGRGVDGRLFPWGDAWHPEWSNVGSTFARPRPVPIGDFPLDVSPYGIRGLGGNVSDWLHDGFSVASVDTDGGRAPVVPNDEVYGTFAGGAWNSGAVYARCSNLGRYQGSMRVTSLGFRLVRPISGP